jgi:hypothetical protein
LELPRFRGRYRTFGPVMDRSGLATSFTATGRGPADRAGQAPPFPVRCPTGGMAQPGPRNLDLQDLAGVGDHQVADPRRQCGAPGGYGMLGLPRLLQGAPLGIREADEDALRPGEWFRRSPTASHGFSDITISGRRTRDLGRCAGPRHARTPLVGERG